MYALVLLQQFVTSSKHVIFIQSLRLLRCEKEHIQVQLKVISRLEDTRVAQADRYQGTFLDQLRFDNRYDHVGRLFIRKHRPGI